tara:strand:+ start:295 stop:417 length:123 start_codon:yes stop_codon:yes gene_type:complete
VALTVQWRATASGGAIMTGYCGDRERAQSKDRGMLTTRQR